MFTADCDQCGARNTLPASAQDEGINSGSIIPCPNCGADVCVRLSLPPTGSGAVTLASEAVGETISATSESVGEPIGEAIVPKDEPGEDEATQVLEPSALPDSEQARVLATASASDELEPVTPRHGASRADADGDNDIEPATARRGPSTEGEAAALGDELFDGRAELESSLDAPDSSESLVPLSDRDFLPNSENPGRHLPVPPKRERHANANANANPAMEAGEEAPLSFGTPTLAALVRKGNPPPRREHREPRDPAERREDERDNQDVLVPPAGPIDELWDARVIPMLRQPTTTDAPVASMSRPPEAPKGPSRSNGALGFALLVAGVAFVAGLAVKNARETESAQQAIPAAAPIPEAPAVTPMPQPAAADVPVAPSPAPAEQPSESAAVASPPPALAAPEPNAKRGQSGLGFASDSKAPEASRAPNSGASTTAASANDAPRSTVAPVRSATVSTETPPAEVAFNADATATALDAAALRASSCKKPADPSGVAVVTITFAPTGRVTSANISGPPFAGTETGGCIASVLRSVKVPAYTGDFMTVKKTIQVQ
jgi:hypothetical protein